MNMKQSCKALICAIEGELDGRHCTEEQAAAILDHALPSLTEALARLEADRDTATRVLARQIDKSAAVIVERDTAQAQLAEMRRVAAGFLFNYDDGVGKPWERRLLDYARKLVDAKEFNVQAEQQEAQEYNAYAEPPYGRTGKYAEPPVRLEHKEAQGAQALFGDEDHVSIPRGLIGAACAAITRKSENPEKLLAELRRYTFGDLSAALATQPAAGEPVYQLRNPNIGPEWHEVDDVQYEEFSSISAYERRILWTVPPAAAGDPEQQTAINTDDLPTKKYPLGAFDFDAPVAADEPVAWMYESAELREPIIRKRRLAATDDPWAEAVSETALYTAPPAAAPVAAGEPVAFANELISGALQGGDFSGADIQELAVKHGLLREEHRDEACRDEGCACAEYGFPTECYRKTDALAPPAAAHGDEAVRKDAERYRWLRKSAAGVHTSGGSEVKIDPLPWPSITAPETADYFDAAIDAAMRAQAGEGGEV